MNIHLSQINSFPFQSDAAHGASTHPDAAELLGVDIKRPVKSRALGRRLAHFLTYLTQLPRQISERDELERCTDRELADMGITRGDIGRIHDPSFAADRAARDSVKWL